MTYFQITQSLIISLLLLNKASITNASSSSSNHSPNMQFQTQEQKEEIEKYNTLPHIIFAPSGQLHAINEAYTNSKEDDDITSSLGIALKCKQLKDEDEEDGDDDEDGFIVFVCTYPISPHLHRPVGVQAALQKQEEEVKKHQESLWALKEEASPRSLTILGQNTISFVGGNAIHASILLRRIQEMSLHLHRTTCIAPGLSTCWSNHVSSSVNSDILAKKIADTVQLSTQSMGGDDNATPILLSSALILAINEHKVYDKHYDTTNIWRIDPTGQFWNCDIGIVGRGSTMAESILLQQINKQRNLQHHDTNENHDSTTSAISNTDIQQFLNTLSVNYALSLASNCIRDTLNMNKEDDDDSWSLLHAVIMRYDKKNRRPKILFLHGAQLKERLEVLRSASTANSKE